MEQNNKKPSAYSNVKNGFYKQIHEKDKKQKIIIVATVIAVLLLASLLLYTSIVMETWNDKVYTYVYGDYNQNIFTSTCFVDGIQLIDMNSLANYSEISIDDANGIAMFKVNGTYASFENGSEIAIVNGMKTKMPFKAQIKNGYCLVPLSTVNDIIHGLQIVTNEDYTTVSKTGQTMYIIDKNPKIEYATEMSEYLEYINSDNEYIYTLLNKKNPIDEDFEPNDLVIIPEKYTHSYKHGTKIYLDGTTMKALEAMIKDMEAEGISDVFVQSAYRTHSYQSMLFNMYIEREMEAGLSREEATIKANKYSARPEFSEHRTGLCIDFTTNSISGAVDDVFETTEAFHWLNDNAWKYGFIMRYPEDKEDITGYIYESWHYRFVGLEVASVIHQTGLCYEEYLEIFGN